MTKSQPRQNERIEEIFQIAMELFIERGYDNTPLSLIAKEANLSKSGLFHYFSSKEHLLFLVHKHIMEKHMIPILDEAEREPDPEKRLRTFIHGYIGVVTRDQKTTQMLMHEAKRLLPEHYMEIYLIWRRILSVFSDAIAGMKDQGKVPGTLNTSFAAFAAIGMCIWTPNWFDIFRPESKSKLVDTFIRIFMAGISADSAPSEIRYNLV